jgi:hypothetical protein
MTLELVLLANVEEKDGQLAPVESLVKGDDAKLLGKGLDLCHEGMTTPGLAGLRVVLCSIDRGKGLAKEVGLQDLVDPCGDGCLQVLLPPDVRVPVLVLEVGIVPTLVAQGREVPPLLVMGGEEEGVVGEALVGPVEGVPMFVRVPARKVRPAGAADEQRVPHHQPALDYQGDGVSGVSRCMDDVDGQLAQGEDVAVGDPTVDTLGTGQLVHDVLAAHLFGQLTTPGEVVRVGVGVHGQGDPESKLMEPFDVHLHMVEHRIDEQGLTALLIGHQIGLVVSRIELLEQQQVGPPRYLGVTQAAHLFIKPIDGILTSGEITPISGPPVPFSSSESKTQVLYREGPPLSQRDAI